MSEEWKPGDVVVLKSGSPKMVVVRILAPGKAKDSDEGDVWCSWWSVRKGKFDRRLFSAETLKKAPAGK